ncbi:MAG: sugar transferase [Balneolales bacterium]|nr:sugar transferase [Balneolales bacterium]
MKIKKDIIATLAGDFGAFVAAWYAFYHVRFELNWFEHTLTVAPATLLLPAVVTAAFWVAIFAFFGLYKRLYLISRFDELIRVCKISIVGTLIFFFLLFTDDLNWNSENISYAKNYTILYWALVFSFVSFSRLTIRTVQRAIVKRGYGLHKAIIIGTGQTAREVYEDIKRHRTTGLDVVGFISTDHHDTSNSRIENQTEAQQNEAISNSSASVSFTTKELAGSRSYSSQTADIALANPDVDIETPKAVEPILTESAQEDSLHIIGSISSINEAIDTYQVEDVIVAMESDERLKLVDILDRIDKPNISIKIIPDFYQIISGLNQTNQIFGLPLIEVMPDPMPVWEKSVKRLMDIVLSLIILIVSLPVMLITALLIKLTSKGPAIFSQERVGLYANNFMMYKFRSMYQDAESKTGPTWAKENDKRITPLGYWLRKLRLDELPQLYNVLKGDMSLVGPRPERPFFVNQFKKDIPLYSRRLRVRPGITGWAQVKWKYDETFDDVIEKTKYDLFYVENISLKMDLKILINTIFTMLSGKGQ